MSYPAYLIHFNKNHSAKNGQFVSGDGDGDGIVDDHKNQRKKIIGKITKAYNAVKKNDEKNFKSPQFGPRPHKSDLNSPKYGPTSQKSDIGTILNPKPTSAKSKGEIGKDFVKGAENLLISSLLNPKENIWKN